MAETVEISVLGPPAVRDAMEALAKGRHVVLSGSGLSLTGEAELKRRAFERGLLLLGPECHTSLVGGEGFGIWNSVRGGPVGIIGTSGSGIREVSYMVDEVGISHALEVGTRDLSQKVGGLGTFSALKFLGADESTKVIVTVALTPSTSVARRVLDAVKDTGKPSVVCFLGAGRWFRLPKGVIQVSTLEDAATHAVALIKGQKPLETFAISEAMKKIAEDEYEHFGYGQRYIRGLYSGGMLGVEAMEVLGG